MFLAEGSSCFRASALMDVAGYDPAFIRGKEGTELSLQFYTKGHQLLLCPQFATLHWLSGIHRSLSWTLYCETRHTIWMLAKHWPTLWLPPLIGTWVVLRGLAFYSHAVGTAAFPG